jgi:hypothetical protein
VAARSSTPLANARPRPSSPSRAHLPTNCRFCPGLQDLAPEWRGLRKLTQATATSIKREGRCGDGTGRRRPRRPVPLMQFARSRRPRGERFW